MAENGEPFEVDSEDRLLLLVLRYFDGDLTAVELHELNELLRTDETSRLRFVEFCNRGCLIRETFEPERQALLRHEQHVARTNLAEEKESANEPETSALPRRPRWRRRLLVAASLALMATAATILWWIVDQRGRENVIGTLEQVTGDVRVLGPQGNVRAVTAGVAINSGDTLRTHGARSEAVLLYPDGTRLTLVGETSVTCGASGNIYVVTHHGTLTVSAQPQPADRPLVLATPTARLQVLGTRFLVEALANQTNLSVFEGRVRLLRISDGKAVEVGAGKRLLAAEGAALVVEDIAKPPDTWELDFEDGLPKNLRRGRFVNEGLPRGSMGAVAAVRADLGEFGIVYEIRSPEQWYQGLFAVHEDSHLHFTYKMDRPSWLNVFIIARGPDSEGPHTGNYLAKDLPFPREAGRWHTVSIPVAEFARAGFGKGPPLARNEIPYVVLFSADADRGLVIDRMWVTRGGPGVVQFRPVE